MKGYKFYLEYPTRKDKASGTRKAPGNHSGNVLTVIDDTVRVDNHKILYDALGAVLFMKNSPAAFTSVCYEYLNEHCKRISENLAREIHPELFKVLDSE